MSLRQLKQSNPFNFNRKSLGYRLWLEHGEGLPELLRALYVDEMLPLRQLAEQLGGCSYTKLVPVLEAVGIEVRRGSAAIANQWARNPERRKRMSEISRRTMRDRKERGEKHWAEGHTKDTHPGLRAISEKLRESGRLLKTEVVAKATESRRKLFRADPSRHPNSKASPTRAEQVVMDLLKKIGVQAIFQYPVQIDDRLLFIDVVVPSLNLAIEISKAPSRCPPSRLRLIKRAGFIPMAIPNTGTSGDLSHLQDQIARAQRGEWHPSTIRECWVLRRRAWRRSAADKSKLDEAI